MLFSTVSAPMLFLFGLQSFVSGQPVSDGEQGLKDIRSTSGFQVMGKMEVVDNIQSRFISAERDENRLNGRGLVTVKLTGDQSGALGLHNAARAKLGLGSLSWDTNLEAKAKAWAYRLVQMKQLQTQNIPKLGENVGYQFSTKAISNPISLATKGWLATKTYYHNEIIPNGNFRGYATYTQCVWKKTTRVGIAAATDGKGTWYVVAYYSPAGNVYGSKPY